MKKYFFGTHWYWYWLIIGILIIAVGMLISAFESNIICSFILKFFKDWSAALSAAAAGILAIVAFLAIRNANQQEAIRRKYDLEKESRDRKEQYLNEIIEWAEESVKSAIHRQRITSHELWKAILNYKYCISKSEYVNVIAAESFSALPSLIGDVVRELNGVMKETSNYEKDKTDGKHKLMRDCEDKLTKSGEKLFKEAAKIKSVLLNSHLSKS